MIEGSLSPNIFSYHSVDFWPYIRISLIARLKQQHKTVKKSHKVVYVLSEVRATIKKILLNYLYRFLLDRAGNQPEQDYKIMLLAPYAHRFDKCGSGYLNKHADSLRNSTLGQDKIGLIEYAFNFKSRKKRASASYLHGFLPEFLELKYRFLSVFGNNHSLVSADWQYGTDCINTVFKKQNINISVRSGSLHLEVQRVFELATHCKAILRKFKVEHLINVVYCNYTTIAFILAAKQLGINTTEYQHGSQDETHPHYTKWSLIGSSGYTLLPQNYWVWNQYTLRYMREWADKTTYHKVTLTGNFYLSSYVTKSQPKPKKKNIVLLTLQDPKLLPAFMYDAIQRSSREWHWWVREHPRYPLDQQTWAKFIECSNGQAVDVSDSDLYELFSNVKIHTTGYSTCAFEAEQFNVPTVFFDTLALDGYQSLINKCPHLNYADNVQKIMQSFDSLPQVPIVKSGFIETAIHSVDELLGE